jgi:uncharacterized protein YjbJ (UPF0337 family)
MADQEKWEGRGEQAGGQVKEKAGEMTGDKEMENRGKAEQAEGGVKEKMGEAKEKVKDAF